MEKYWLHKQGSASCILFLAGWGMDPSPFRSIPVGAHDLCIVYDYRSCEPSSILTDIRPYSTVHLLAWSMGVWVAGRYFAQNKTMFSSATSINGTLHPIDDRFGIPSQPFAEMIENFSAPLLEKFYQDMFDEQNQAERFLRTRPKRSLASIRSELVALQQLYNADGPGENLFTSRIVGTRDRIFQARSQLRSWDDSPCDRIKTGHFPFYSWPSWDAIIAGVHG